MTFRYSKGGFRDSSGQMKDDRENTEISRPVSYTSGSLSNDIVVRERDSSAGKWDIFLGIFKGILEPEKSKYILSSNIILYIFSFFRCNLHAHCQ